MSIALLTGLPRFRSAWLSNFLTHGSGLMHCHHDLFKDAPTVVEMANVLRDGKSLMVGNADSAIPLIGVELDRWLFNDSLIEARWVFVRRDKQQALESFQKFNSQEPYPLIEKITMEGATKAFDILEEKLNELMAAVPSERKMVVHYDNLGKENVMRDIWRFVAGSVAFPEARWKMLETFRINVIPSKITINSRERLEASCR